jgi:hypothetical protein
MNRIAWSAFDPLEKGTTNEDPLGFFAYAMRLADEWLPGITTRTRRLRYYSMVCAGLYLICDEFGEEIRATENRDAKRVALFLRWERLWVLWNVAVGRAALPGLIGRLKAEVYLRDGVPRPPHLDYTFIARQPDLGALGSYRTSLQAFELMREDEIELTPEGERLAEQFWDQAPPGTWTRAAAAIESGRLPRSGRLAGPDRIGETLGLSPQEPSDSLAAEIAIVRCHLLAESGGGARRTEVFDYVRRHALGRREEEDILGFAARRARRHSGGAPLERRAAVIIAVEAFRVALMKVVTLFRTYLVGKGGRARPKDLWRSPELHGLLRAVRATHRDVLRFSHAPEFAHIFEGFPFPADYPTGDGPRLLEALLELHQAEMARRRSPRWFTRTGQDQWELDPSVAYPPDEDGPLDPYPYRTSNLLTLARDARCRL